MKKKSKIIKRTRKILKEQTLKEQEQLLYEQALREHRLIDEKILKEKLLKEHLLKEQLLNEQLLKEQALKDQEEAELLADENTDNEASETESNAESKGLTDDLQDDNSDTIDAQMLDVTRDTRGEIHNANNMINADYEANQFMEYLLFENAHKDENGQCLVSDISKITPTKYHTEKHKKLKPITPAFIDTIMLFKLIDSTNTFKQNGTVLIDKEICGFWNTKLRTFAKNHSISLPKHGVVCKKNY